MDYSSYEKVLKNNVTDSGIVDYESIIRNDLDVLNRFLDQISRTDPQRLSTDEQLAFWINAYNAFTIKLIIDHWPLRSIMEIYDGEPWDKKWIGIDDKTYSLDDIEHDIIRDQFGDPRIHFAVNCAAKSCPPLLNKPYTGATLDKQLEDQTRKFINDSRSNQISQNQLILSKIFEWYAEDFADLKGFLNKYSESDINPDASVRYNTYDWTINN
ncbi:MAG TPA: DUF547 domain-containing protein [Membranihabitans sp.]|nr:DUF547 domain-containing protein [Membranihabitans sp.]